jgi:hypothetical protein
MEAARLDQAQKSLFFFAIRDYIDHMGVRVPRVPIVLLCVLIALPAVAEDQLWEWVTPTPQGHDLFAAAAGNGVTVAVGRNGTVITSTDSIEWRTSHTGAGYSLSDVVWGNGLFVAVGGQVGFEASPGLGVILTSSDGFNWIERHREDYLTLEAVIWTGTRFVAVGIGDRALLSDDGLAWSENQFEDTEFMLDLAWNGSLMVAIGRDGYWLGSPTFFTSENGDEWQQSPFNRDYAPSAIAASGGRFVAVGSEKDALVSDDGLSWVTAPYESSTELRGIVDGGDRFLATGNDVFGTSFDGYVWSVEERHTESRVYGLAWLGDGYLAVGEDGFMMWSPEGSEWTELSAKSFDIRGSWEINELATNGSTIVGVGEGSLIITGKHGTEWVRRSSPVSWGELNSVIWAGSAFWAVGSPGVLSSFDGVHWTWTEMIDDADVTLYDIVWNGALYVAVGRDYAPIGGRRSIVTSRDGHEWTYHEILFPVPLHAVGWTGSQFVAAGDGDLYLTSTEGEIWQQHSWPNSRDVRDMAWSGNRLVAVGGRWGVGGFILSTTDGIHWVECELPIESVSYFDDVTWTGTHFIAVSRSSGDVIFTSTDGISWSSETTGTGVWPVSVVGDERSLFTTGRGLQIIRRTTPLADPEPPRRSGRRVLSGGKKLRMAPSIQK